MNAERELLKDKDISLSLLEIILGFVILLSMRTHNLENTFTKIVN